jgi:hypothetical protein
MAEKKLNIKVSTTGAAKAKQQVGGLNGAISKMGKAVGIASAAYFGARGLISGFSTIIKLAGEQERVEKKLETALGHVNTALLAQASAFQKQSQHGDEAIISMMALASNMGIAEDKISETTKMAIGLSEALGVDLNMAMKAAAGAIQGDTNMLTRYIPELKTTKDLTEKLEIVQMAANKGFEQSIQATKTMDGSMGQAGMAVGDLGESLGTLLSPAVISASGAIKNISNDLIDFINILNHNKSANTLYYEEVEKTEAILEKFSDSLGIVIDPALSLTDQLEFLRSKAQEINDGEFLKGVAFSDAATALQETRGQVDLLTIAFDNFKATALDMPDRPLINIFDPDEIDILPDVIIDMKEMNDMMDEAFGSSDDNSKKMVDQIKLAGALSDALQTTFDPDLGAGEAFKGFVLQLMSAMQGVILASKVVSEALTFTFTGPLGIGAAAAALVGLEAAKAGVRSLEFAETGFDGIVNSPTMFMTGEGNKAERVSVTPLQGPNINGPQGGMTINFNNAIMSSDFTRDQIIPQIQQAIRMNLA